jgi:hypothetical protein
MPLLYCGPVDIDCNGDVNPIDVVKILRYDAGLPVQQEPGCPPIGEPP